MTIEEAKKNIGRTVVYKKEVGVITKCTTAFVFVRYGKDLLSKATNPRDLELEHS